ncbi:MAG: hypothetical protein HYT82_00965 [Candidatus Harrisonbacteria bacterium]|nr:hypothetical protein [Candidatus Harrisonbacteria bacterium]
MAYQGMLRSVIAGAVTTINPNDLISIAEFLGLEKVPAEYLKKFSTWVQDNLGITDALTSNLVDYTNRDLTSIVQEIYRLKLEAVSQCVKEDGPLQCPAPLPPVCEEEPPRGGAGAVRCNEFGNITECSSFDGHWHVSSGLCKPTGQDKPPGLSQEYWAGLPAYPFIDSEETTANGGRCGGAPAGAPAGGAGAAPAPGVEGKAQTGAPATKSGAAKQEGKGGFVAQAVVPATAVKAAVAAAKKGKAISITLPDKTKLIVSSVNGNICARLAGTPTNQNSCAAAPKSGGIIIPLGATAAPPAPTPKLVTAPAARFDFGDAPTGFPTTRAENGPRHVLSNRVWLGAQVDGEADARRVNADNFDDGMLQSNPQFILRVRTGRSVARTVYVNVWEDWNGNNRWDINANGAPGDEWIVRNQPVQVRANSSQDVALVQPRNGPDGRPLPAAWSDPRGWVRFTVTETRIRNGNPAIGQFTSGGTEDYVDVARTIDEGGLRPPSGDGKQVDGGGVRPADFGKIGGSCGASQDCPSGYTCAIEGNVGTCVPTGGAVPATGGGLKSSAAPTRTFFGSLLELLRR